MSPWLSYLFQSYGKKMLLRKQNALFAMTAFDRYDLENSHLQVFSAISPQDDMQSTVESSGLAVYTSWLVRKLSPNYMLNRHGQNFYTVVAPLVMFIWYIVTVWVNFMFLFFACTFSTTKWTATWSTLNMFIFKDVMCLGSLYFCYSCQILVTVCHRAITVGW